jgi:hypothetical protein
MHWLLRKSLPGLNTFTELLKISRTIHVGVVVALKVSGSDIAGNFKMLSQKLCIKRL